VRAEAGEPVLVESPNTAGEIMTTEVVSVLVGTSVRDVAILLLEKRIKANSPKTSILISSRGP
jgi:Mg/Co/Ni transporter MgtE